VCFSTKEKLDPRFLANVLDRLTQGSWPVEIMFDDLESKQLVLNRHPGNIGSGFLSYALTRGGRLRSSIVHVGTRDFH
jgi:hypothetical protein